MILRELIQCHAVRAANPDPERPMPPAGWSTEKMHLRATLSPAGELLKLEPLGKTGEKGGGVEMIVPGSVSTRNSGEHPNRLWDKMEIALGVGADKDGKTKKEPSLWKSFAADNLAVFGGAEDSALRAFCAFLKNGSPERSEKIIRQCAVDWKELGNGRNVAFAVKGELLHDLPAARAKWNAHPFARACWIPPKLIAQKTFRAQCMASGGESECAATHPKIKGVENAQSSGASIVSFDKAAFTSHGWAQNKNAPLGLAATFQYATALNWLLRNNRIRLAGNSVVFWAETPADAERDIAPWMGGKIPEGEDDNSLREKLNSMRKGKLPAPVEKSADSRFFVLGLAGNAGRIAVRFWHESTVGQVWENLRRHQADLDVGAQFVPRPHSLMRALSKPGENGDIPANLSAGFLRAVLSGEKYPAPLLPAALNRFQNDRQDKSDKKAEYEFRNRENARAALVKAILIRNHQKEITPMLNPETPSDPYQLGRLFAVLESVQRSAHGGESPNATIRDRFIGGALSRPADVFPQLLKLAAHHMRGGHRDEKKIGEILNRIPAESEKPAIPRSFTLEEQGMFFLGYYHQREQNFRDAAAAKKRKSGEQLKNNQSAEAEKE